MTTASTSVQELEAPPRLLPRLRHVDWSQVLIVGVAAVAAVTIVILLGLIVWMSLRTGVPAQPSPYTLENYHALLSDPYNYEVLGTTLAFALVTIAVAVPSGAAFAWLLERTDLPGKTVAATLLSMGILIPTFLKAMGWVFLLHPRIGALNLFLVHVVGLESSPFNIATVVGMGFVQGITLAPVAYVMVAAALRRMNPALVEAAAVHGVGIVRSLLRVELPLVWPALLSVMIWLFTIAIAAFDVPAVIGMTNNIFTFSTALYFMVNPAEGLPQYGLSGAYGTIMIGLSLFLMIPYFAALRHSHRYQIISGKGYQTRPIELGRWRVLGWSALLLYVLLAVVLPLLSMLWASLLPYMQAPSWRALASLSLERYTNVFVDDALISSGLNTLFLMFAVPTAIVFFSAAISWVVTRSRLRGRMVLDAIAFLPHPVPNLLFALAIAYLALVVSHVVPIYGSIYLLVLAYTLVWIGFGTRTLNSNMLQVHRELEEAAQVGGASALRIVRKIIVPLIRPGLVYAWIWTSLLAYRELTMAVLLSSPENQVISTFIWGEWTGGGLGDAATAGILMVVIMSPLVAGFWTVARRQLDAAES